MTNEIRGPLPVKVDATSNGEFRPVPLTKPVARANREAEIRIGENAKRVGLGRRAFLQSLCGAATTLLTLNEAFAALGNIGGLFRVPKESAFETATAAEALAGDEFIFDVQTHMVDPVGAWKSVKPGLSTMSTSMGNDTLRPSQKRKRPMHVMQKSRWT